MPNENSRGRGILSSADRRFIRDPEAYIQEHSAPSVRERRREVRKRVANAMADLRLLADELPDDELEAIFAGDDEDSEDPQAHLPAAVRFLLRVADREDEQLYPGLDHQPAYADFVESTETALQRDIAGRKGDIADVDVTISVDNLRPPEVALDALDAGEVDPGHTLEVAAALRHAGVSQAAVSDALEGSHESDVTENTE